MSLLELLVVEHLKRLVQTAAIVAGVVYDTERHLVAAFERSDEVAAAHCNGIARQLRGESVHHALHYVGGFWSTCSAIGINGRGVREHAIDGAADVLESVAAVQHQAE